MKTSKTKKLNGGETLGVAVFAFRAKLFLQVSIWAQLIKPADASTELPNYKTTDYKTIEAGQIRVRLLKENGDAITCEPLDKGSLTGTSLHWVLNRFARFVVSAREESECDQVEVDYEGVHLFKLVPSVPPIEDGPPLPVAHMPKDGAIISW